MNVARLASLDTSALAETFAARVTSHKTPGSYFALFTRDDVVAEGGFGSQKLMGRAPDRGTVFRIASCTKSFTAATLLILRDQGALDLDTPITRFVPEFLSTSPISSPIAPTVRMLMTMSGGLPSDDPWGDRQESLTTDQFLGVLRTGVQFVSVPGTAYEYSNLGYAMLGLVIEALSGRPYARAVKELLLDPLGLDNTAFEAGFFNADQLAIGCRRSGDEWCELPFSSPGAFSPIGGLFTTASDLMRWSRWLASALDVDNTESGPLSAASRREMQQISRAFPHERGTEAPSGYGYGLMVEADPLWGHTAFHSGGYPGFSTHMRWNAPSGFGIVAFENATYSCVAEPAASALRTVLEQLGKPNLAPTLWPATVELQAKADALIRHWQDGRAGDIFADNVGLDVPLAERTEAITSAIAELGGLTHRITSATLELSDSPAHAVWHIPALRGRLRCEIRLAPTLPARIQTIKVSAELEVAP